MKRRCMVCDCAGGDPIVSGERAFGVLGVGNTTIYTVWRFERLSFFSFIFYVVVLFCVAVAL